MNQLSSFKDSQVRPSELVGNRHPAAELYVLIQELSRTARRLQEHAGTTRSGDFRHEPHEYVSDELVEARVRRVLVDRARRNRIFPAELFADPAWDILLHLYSSHLAQQRETITGIISLSGLPATTGLRWVHKLVDEGLLILRDDPLDLRRKWVLLSPTASASLHAHFRADPHDA